MTITLVILSLDEREALPHLLPKIPPALFDRVIAIDPGSTDGTLDIYRDHGIEVVIQERRGRGAAFQLAAEIVDTDGVVFALAALQTKRASRAATCSSKWPARASRTCTT